MKQKIVVTLSMLAVLLIVEIFLTSSHPEKMWLHFPGSEAWLGALGGILLMKIAKILGQYWLSRKDDYYHG